MTIIVLTVMLVNMCMSCNGHDKSIFIPKKELTEPHSNRHQTGGEGGIRTLGTCECTLVFETSQFNHSCTSPYYFQTLPTILKQKLLVRSSLVLFWYARQELNLRPPVPQTGALSN